MVKKTSRPTDETFSEKLNLFTSKDVSTDKIVAYILLNEFYCKYINNYDI
ncbi:hypothetical protein Curi_c07870 [Gottschalkia acidurici 9a]|uniref:Uncharacterized protein n=1 Tax=Gottschalkia acidurici (strain ATCC 7906 / DSM 604 / BCRC 14475 / CIP 104303 / KCTC 5404 / NCIMB 10678 / 9a) TaxID=1128398 RepID=K0AYR1_GOTA9|nr:hypothetical protein Curi_c07870 [Gottschalkia acidurici 9a]